MPSPSGVLIVDKPSGLTSHDVVAVGRRALKTSRVGHTGTLDPLATGVLVLLVGQATRLSRFLVSDEKEYVADIRLGVATRTYDAESLGNAQSPTPNVQIGELQNPTLRVEAWASGVDAALAHYRGTFLQMPPPFSAKKIAGQRAYARARRDEPVTLAPVEVSVRELERLASDDPMLVRLRVVVSSGFYVRSLAHDLGQRLGCGAHLEALRRTRVGRFALADAVTLDQLDGDAARRLLDLNQSLGDMPAITLSDEGVRRVQHGNAIAPAHVAGAPLKDGSADQVRLLDATGALLAVAARRPDGSWQPQVVLVQMGQPDVKC